VEFGNRVLVLFQWAWNYLTWNRPARLITGEKPLPIQNREGFANSQDSRPEEAACHAPGV
jgi:NADH:ubiquinone reductase (H+-translocating)